MNSPFIRAAVNILIIIGVLTACTFVYSFYQDSPPKIIAYFITTFIISLLGGVVILLIGRLINVPKESFLARPNKVILSLILIIGLSRIVSAAISQNEITELNKATNQPIIESELNSFSNSDYGISFLYPSNWTQQSPQRPSTLTLLYENSGTEATCNLSVVPQDQSNVENYNSDYFNNNLSKVYKEFNNIENEIKIINGKTISWTTYDFIFPIEGKTIQGTSITLTTLHNDNRFMLIFNVPKQNMDFIVKDIKTISESLTFIENIN